MRLVWLARTIWLAIILHIHTHSEGRVISLRYYRSYNRKTSETFRCPRRKREALPMLFQEQFCLFRGDPTATTITMKPTTWPNGMIRSPTKKTRLCSFISAAYLSCGCRLFFLRRWLHSRTKRECRPSKDLWTADNNKRLLSVCLAVRQTSQQQQQQQVTNKRAQLMAE